MSNVVSPDIPTTELARVYPWALRIMRFDDDGLFPGDREAFETAKSAPMSLEDVMGEGGWFPLRSEWGLGPWQTEPDLVEWRMAGVPFPLIIARGSVGALCGYVGVPPGHPCHGGGGPGVHSEGITGGGPCGGLLVPTGDPPDCWWLGFDCAHRGATPRLDAGLRLITQMTGIPLPDFGLLKHPYVTVDECRPRTEALALELFGVTTEHAPAP